MEQSIAISSLLMILTMLATAAMAIAGVLQAIRTRFDPFGAAVLALITAVGGGTVRDLLLGAAPVFWITDLTYIATVIPVVIVGVFFARKMRKGGGNRLKWLSYFDAIGLGLFTILGVIKALEFGVNPMIAVILGCITGVVGGMLRDILCGEQPIVLKEGLYATFSLLGGAMFIISSEFLSQNLSALLAFGFIVIGRAIAIQSELSLNKLDSK